MPITPLRLRSTAGRRHLLTACRYFAVERIALARGETVIAITSGSPQTLTVLLGGVMAATGDGDLPLQGGDTAIVTAACATVTLTASAPAIVLRTWVPDLEREVMAPALAAGHDAEQVVALSGSLSHLVAVGVHRE